MAFSFLNGDKAMFISSNVYIKALMATSVSYISFCKATTEPRYVFLNLYICLIQSIMQFRRQQCPEITIGKGYSNLEIIKRVDLLLFNNFHTSHIYFFLNFYMFVRKIPSIHVLVALAT